MQSSRKRARRAVWVLTALLAPLGAADLGAHAADGSPPPAVSLDRLLTLPTGLPVAAPDERAGDTRVEWQARFAEARAHVESAQKDLDASLGKLKELAAETGGMKVSGPGTGSFNPDVPMNYGLSQEIRAKREALEQAERDLIALGVEADLAGVPREWHAPADENAEAAATK